MNNKKSVVFVDAYNLIYRAFYANQANLTNSEGLPTNALITVAKMLLKLRKNFPDIAHGVAVFDGGGNFRKELDENYKLNRKPMPDNLKLQMPFMKELFECLGWSVYQANNVEADDVIGTLALRASKSEKGYHTYIISGDKDFRQLASHNLVIVDTMNDIEYTPDMVKEKMGVFPSQVVDFLAMVGDSTDNVQGITGVADKTAAKFLNLYGSIDGIIENKDKLTGKVGENIKLAIESGQLQKSKVLVTLKTDVEIVVTKELVMYSPVDQVRWRNFCEKMDFKSFLKPNEQNKSKSPSI